VGRRSRVIRDRLPAFDNPTLSAAAFVLSLSKNENTRGLGSLSFHSELSNGGVGNRGSGWSLRARGQVRSVAARSCRRALSHCSRK